MESFMLKMIGTILVGLMAMTGTALAESSEQATPAKCQVAEVNPVTGYVSCIKPLGAPVDPLPATAENPCKPNEHTDAEWSWGPKCAEPKGM